VGDGVGLWLHTVQSDHVILRTANCTVIGSWWNYGTCWLQWHSIMWPCLLDGPLCGCVRPSCNSVPSRSSKAAVVRGNFIVKGQSSRSSDKAHHSQCNCIHGACLAILVCRCMYSCSVFCNSFTCLSVRLMCLDSALKSMKGLHFVHWNVQSGLWHITDIW